MNDVLGFGLAIGLVSVAGLVALLSSRVSAVLRVPAPAVFFVLAAVVSDLVPALGGTPVLAVQRVVTIMLVLLLFDGGMNIGWRRFRHAAGTILWVGIAGTVVTAVGVAAAAHLVLGIGLQPALLLGVALAPTDPAVVFSVLGRREVTGRSGTVLEGESGANDPVGIAAMAAVLGASGLGGWHAVLDGVGDFALQLVVGGVIGVAGGQLVVLAMRRIALPSPALYPVRTLLAAGAIYGLATVAHGSGFLAVFVAGILAGDVRAPYKAEIERFHSSLAGLAEIAAFTLLGLTVPVVGIVRDGTWATGLALGVLLALVVRPILVGLLLLPVRLRWGERLFVLWCGLKGAVPMLLGTYLLSAGVSAGDRLYHVVVVVVLLSVVVQGGLAPWVARRLGVPMRVVEPHPWSLSMRLREEPTGVRRHVIAEGAAADGRTVADLARHDHAWISLISRGGVLQPVTGGTVLRAGDEVVVSSDTESLFDSPADD